LEREERNDLGIVERELDDVSNLFVVDAVHNRGNRHDIYACLVQVVDGAQLHVEQVSDLAMLVGGVTNSVELQIDVAQAGFSSLAAEFFTLGKLDAVGGCLDAVVANLARVAHCIQEVRRKRGLAAGELYRHLPARLDGNGVVEQSLDLFPTQLMDKTYLVGVHEAGIAHHVATVGEINGEDRAAAVLDGGGAMLVQLL